VTSAVRSWYGGSTVTVTSGTSGNHGFCLTIYNAGINDYNEIVSGDHPNTTYRPEISITYSTGSTTNDKPPQTLVNGKYYIKNFRSGKFLTADAVKGEGSIVTQKHFYNGTSRQQWNVTYDSSTGYYNIKSAYDTSRSLRPATTANEEKARLYTTDTGMWNQQWKINAESSSGGRILDLHLGDCTKVLEGYNNTTGNSAHLWTDHGGINQRWVFESVSSIPLHGKFYALGATSTGSQDFVSWIDSNSNSMNLIGTSFLEKRKGNLNKNQTLTDIKDATFFISHTHGDYNKIQMTDISTGPGVTIADINGLPVNALKKARLVMYLACLTGQGGEGAENLVNATYDKGAKTVIGWKVSIANWEANIFIEGFLEDQASGNSSIGQSIDTSIKNIYMHSSDIEQYYYRGSIEQNLAV
jgi:hypothetical protein